MTSSKFARVISTMVASSAQSLPNSQARSQMDIYVPGIVLRSIMSCGGPSFFLQRSKKEPSENGVKNTPSSKRRLPIHAVSQNQVHRICSNGKLPDPHTVSEWLQNGSINRDKLQNVKERKLRTTIAPTTTEALQTVKQSFQDLEGPISKPSKDSWPDNHSKVARNQQRKLEDNAEGNVLKEALQGLIIGLSSAVLFCSILFRFVLKNKV